MSLLSTCFEGKAFSLKGAVPRRESNNYRTKSLNLMGISINSNKGQGENDRSCSSLLQSKIHHEHSELFEYAAFTLFAPCPVGPERFI